MRRYPVFAVLSSLALAFVPFGSGTGSPQSTTLTSVEGIVVKIGAADVRLQFPGRDGRVVESVLVDQGGTPLEGATLELTCIVGTDVRSYTARTDRDGRFILRDIPPGQGYQLVAIYSPEYLAGQYGQPAPGLPGLPLSLSAGTPMSNIRIALWPAAQVSGQVRDRTGRPVRAVVTAYKPWYMETWRMLARTTDQSKTGLVARVQTNDRGEYHFQGLPAGQYYFHAASTSSNIQIGNVRGFYFSSFSDPVELNLGETVSGLDITGDLLMRTVIQGQAIDQRTGMPVRLSQLMIVRDGDIPEILHEGNSGPSAVSIPGGFALSLHPGSYVLTAIARGMSGRMNLDVGNSAAANLQFPLSPLADIEGRVTIDGNLAGAFAADGAPVKVILRSRTAPIPNILTRVSPDGTFQLRSIPAGDYRVDVHPFLSAPPEENVPQNWKDLYVLSVRFGRDDILNDGLHIETSSANRVEVTVATNGGVVAGRILNDRRTPVVNARAVLVPGAARRRRGDLYKSALTDDTGQFEIRGVPPGDYKVFAWELVEFGAWQDPQFIKIYENLGTSIRVSEGRRQSADVTIIRALNLPESN